MTAPVWMAFPPEVHATSLSSGPGPGPMLAAAAQWHLVSAEYLSTAADLEQILGSVGAWSWHGSSADRYVGSHLAFLGWLTHQSGVSAATATQLETAAAAYTAAVVAMPTVSELATNHAVHAALLATNFLGINTIPLAVNEADYMRMWIQAATTMEIYQAVSEAAVMSAAPSVPAPPILSTAGQAFGASTVLLHRIAEAQAAESGSALASSNSIADQLDAFLRDPLGTLRRILTDFAMNPIEAAITWAPLLLVLFGVYLTAHGTAGTISWGLVIGSLGIWLPFVVGAALPTPEADGEEPAVADVPIRSGSAQVNRAESPTIAVAPSSASGVSTTASAAPSSANASAPSTATASPTFPYLVPPTRNHPPATAFGPTLDEGTTNRAPASGASAVEAAAAPARSGVGRRRRARDRDPVRQRMDMEVNTTGDSESGEPPAHSTVRSTAGVRGAGVIGVTGAEATPAPSSTARGLVVGQSESDVVRSLPMLPTSWDASGEPPRTDSDS